MADTRFDGVGNCGHTKNMAVHLVGPMKHASRIGDNFGMHSALPYRTCNGDCSYESLWFERSAVWNLVGVKKMASTADFARPPFVPPATER